MKNYSRLFLLISLFAMLLLVFSSVMAAPKGGPLVSLSTAQGKFGASEEVLVTVTISNPGGSTVRLLRWFTPAGGIEEPVFSVKRNGEAVAYTGAYYKRPPATASDYITLKAGESITYSVNLGEYYDLSKSGDYQVSYTAASYHLFTEKGNGFKSQDVLTSEAISLKVDGRNPKRPSTPPPPPTPGSNVFDACSATQQVDITSARNQAKTYSSNSSIYLNTNTTGSRYTTWFGVYTSSRYSTVTNQFTKITEAFNNAAITYHCACKQPYYAYVYPTQPYNIYLCKYFWLSPMAGTDSKAGTLIHEMSHFNVVASTDDFVYGQTGAKNLAITAPNDAVMNADNHEYFAENTPPLP